MKCHPELAIRTPQNLTSSRVKLTKKQIMGRFEEVRTYLEGKTTSNGEPMSDFLKDPSRVFNGDEAAFFLNPKGSKVITCRGEKMYILL